MTSYGAMVGWLLASQPEIDAWFEAQHELLFDEDASLLDRGSAFMPLFWAELSRRGLPIGRESINEG